MARVIEVNISDSYIIFFLLSLGPNPYSNLVKKLNVDGKEYKYFDLNGLGPNYGTINPPLPSKMLYLLIFCYRKIAIFYKSVVRIRCSKL